MSEEPKIVVMDRVVSKLAIKHIREPEALFGPYFWDPIQQVIKAAEEAGIPSDRIHIRYWILEAEVDA